MEAVPGRKIKKDKVSRRHFFSNCLLATVFNLQHVGMFMAYFHTQFSLHRCGGCHNQTEATENVRSAGVLLCYNVHKCCPKITFLSPNTFARPKGNGASFVPASCGRASAILLLPNIGN
jgi:hypothetical protein